MNLKRLLSAPVYADGRQNRSAETLNVVQWFTLGCIAIIGAAVALTGRMEAVVIALVVGALVGGSIWLNHHGHTLWGGSIVLVTLLVGVTIQMQLANGVHDIMLLSYMAIIVLASLLLDRRGFIIFNFLVLACLAWLVFGEIAGFFTTPHAALTDPADFLMVGAVLVLTAIVERWKADRLLGSEQKAQHDLIELQRAQEALRLSEEKFSKAFRTSPDAITINRLTDGQFVEINQGFTTQTGYTPDEVAGKTSLELNVWVDPQDRTRMVRGVMTKGEIMNMETRFRRKNGVVDYALISAVRIDIQGEQCILTVARNITERKREEDEIRRFNVELEQRVNERTAQLEEANKELEAFAYSVSHDLRAPLRAITGFSEAIIEEYQDKLDESGVRQLGRILTNANRMGELISDLLEFSRLSRKLINREVVDCQALVAQVVAEINTTHPERSIEWQIHDLADCQADASLLQQVYVNLLENAVKYTRGRDPAHIEVSSRQEDGKTVFFVRDNGAGFSMEHANKLFGVFQRLHPESEFEGTGIGLATVHRIIARHGGRIWVDAEVDQGATFYFTLG